MRPDVGRAETNISQVEADKMVAIDGTGAPAARLVPVEPAGPGATFLTASGSLRGQITISDDFELTSAEIDWLFHGNE